MLKLIKILLDKKLRLLLLIFFFGNFLPNSLQSKTTEEQFIQGSWKASGNTGDFSWYIIWTFKNGLYSNKGYPPAETKGFYKVISSSPGEIVIKIYNSTGTWSDDKEVKIKIDLKKDNIEFSGNKFYRLKE